MRTKPIADVDAIFDEFPHRSNIANTIIADKLRPHASCYCNKTEEAA
jgi:hypothetical protein